MQILIQIDCFFPLLSFLFCVLNGRTQKKIFALFGKHCFSRPYFKVKDLFRKYCEECWEQQIFHAYLIRLYDEIMHDKRKKSLWKLASFVWQVMGMSKGHSIAKT